jgi:tetratricopeptide (TPR) repeat protein
MVERQRISGGAYPARHSTQSVHEAESAMRHSTPLLILASASLLASSAWAASSSSASYIAPGPAAYFSPDAPNGALLGIPDERGAGSTYFRSGLKHLNSAIVQERKGQQGKDEYVRARKAFQYAVKNGDNNITFVPSAWTNIAYIEDKLGNHEAALEAADHALELLPRLPTARENRGEALLGLNRVADAKAEYLDLYPAQPKMAAMLLVTMKQWVKDQRASGTADKATVDELDQWIRDHEQIAQGRAAR